MNLPLLGNAAPPAWMAKPQQAVRPAVAPQMPVNATMAAASAATPAPKIRLQAADAPPITAALRLPTPEELGIPAARPAPGHPSPNEAIDWNEVQAHVVRLGGTNLRAERSVQGESFRVSFLIPTGQDRYQQIEVVDPSPVRAVNAALHQAETIIGRK